MEIKITKCIPDMCESAGLSNNDFCPVIREQPVRLNQLYTGGYTIVRELPVITEGLDDLYGNTLGSWLMIYALSLMVPYVVIFSILLLVLIHNETINFYTGATLIVFVLVASWIGILFIIGYSHKSGNYLKSQTQVLLQQNWEANKEDILYKIGTAYISPDTVTCPSTHTLSFHSSNSSRLSDYSSQMISDPSRLLPNSQLILDSSQVLSEGSQIIADYSSINSSNIIDHSKNSG
jgi:hypothetical protein